VKRIIIIALAIIPALTLAGWWRTYGEEETSERGYCVQQTSDGGYVAVGDKDYDLWLIKTDEAGELLWSRTYGVIGTDYGSCVRQTTDGGYIITGSTGVSPSGSKLWLLKTDPLGDTLWTRTFDDHGPGWVEQTSDSGYVLISNSGRDYDGFHVFKTDSMGDTLWTSYFGELTVGTCVKQTSDGGYIVSGFDVVLPEDYPLSFIYKLDSLGQIAWGSNLIGEGKHGTVEYVQETADGGYIAVTYYTYPPIDLVKTDSLGNTLWSKYYGDGKEFFSAQQATDGGYILVGNPTLLKTNSSGDGLWSKNYAMIGNSVHQTLDGGYIVVGNKDDDLCLVKTDSLGLLEVEEPVTHPVTRRNWKIVTPVGRTITLQAPEDTEPLDLAVLDVSGREVGEIHLTQSTPVNWGQGFSPGVYFIREASGSKTRKIILIK
jgi:hypothetical protein